MALPVSEAIPSGLAQRFEPKDHHYFIEDNWGNGASTLEYPEISQFPQELSFLILGFFAACSSITGTWDNNAYDKFMRGFYKEGADWIWNRYNTTNRGTRHFLFPLLETYNPQLHAQLITSVTRKQPEERVGYFEPEFVPEIHKTRLSFMSRPVSYAGIRDVYMLTETTDLDAIRSQRKNIALITNCVANARSEAQLGVSLAYAAIDHGNADKFTAIEHIFCSGKLHEESNVGAYAAILKEIMTRDQVFHHFVENLSDSDAYTLPFKKMYKIIRQFLETGDYPKRNEFGWII